MRLFLLLALVGVATAELADFALKTKEQLEAAAQLDGLLKEEGLYAIRETAPAMGHGKEAVEDFPPLGDVLLEQGEGDAAVDVLVPREAMRWMPKMRVKRLEARRVKRETFDADRLDKEAEDVFFGKTGYSANAAPSAASYDSPAPSPSYDSPAPAPYSPPAAAPPVEYGQTEPAPPVETPDTLMTPVIDEVHAPGAVPPAPVSRPYTAPVASTQQLDTYDGHVEPDFPSSAPRAHKLSSGGPVDAEFQTGYRKASAVVPTRSYSTGPVAPAPIQRGYVQPQQMQYAPAPVMQPVAYQSYSPRQFFYGPATFVPVDQYQGSSYGGGAQMSSYGYGNGGMGQAYGQGSYGQSSYGPSLSYGQSGYGQGYGSQYSSYAPQQQYGGYSGQQYGQYTGYGAGGGGGGYATSGYRKLRRSRRDAEVATGRFSHAVGNYRQPQYLG